MHIPDGFVNGWVNIGGYLISGSTVAFATAKLRKKADMKQVPLMGVTAAFIFAAQMLNFPIVGGTSGHFLGAVLASVLLGPLSGCLIMTMVLTVQCLGFADGGLTALGTNIFNMGILSGIGGYWCFRLIMMLLPKKTKGLLISVAIASWFSIVLASAGCAMELAISGTSPFQLVFPAMVGVHAIIGLGEAIISVAVISLILAYRKDLLADYYS
jgi:cobalt/nickel transport system permease protein